MAAARRMRRSGIVGMGGGDAGAVWFSGVASGTTGRRASGGLIMPGRGAGKRGSGNALTLGPGAVPRAGHMGGDTGGGDDDCPGREWSIVARSCSSGMGVRMSGGGERTSGSGVLESARSGADSALRAADSESSVGARVAVSST